ncbi:putative fibroblast growth factor 1 isoform X2 [Montipora capricornis]|uniref:putative fibroblast growth factor 1 isoform X2 n=1 Tax=Montipora foliosa TaxID=591990 RepID=UPI0035F1504D
MEARCPRGLMFFYLCLFVGCTYPSTVQGIPLNTRSRHAHGRHPRSDALDKVTDVPTATARGRLLSRTGYFLEILQNGTVRTNPRNSSIYNILEIQTYNKTLKRFLGVESGYFLACEVTGKRRGKFAGERPVSNNSLFEEHMEENGYITYRPFLYTSSLNITGYLAIKENGKFRRVERTHPGMHAAHFQFLELE